MNFNQLKEGLKLEMKLSDEEKSPEFVSQLEWTEHDKILYILAPIYKGRLYPIEKGANLEIYFIQKENFYQFEAEVIERIKRNDIRVLKINTLSDIKKIQRREFFRFECTNPIKYKVIKASKSNLKKGEDLKKTITRDLSGGGVCIKLTNRVSVGDILECELFLNDFDKVGFRGKVVRFSEYGVDRGEYKYEIGVSFEKISEKAREKIVSYIFQEQRRLIKKG
ncbi:flagellar brake protein [Herbivorax sp. ANBcel31]|uniref:flagellar brake protein n=1 Tax=Herbivorax sp. ANBcel31 TaxID=3069754 RepID=UPI0027B43B60|nr:flagellar brake protein [Herbivorax sp. ANBcel31]MDQ2085874.1 flagellar brake protein [Herbivorax sp. ANBcel31]